MASGAKRQTRRSVGDEPPDVPKTPGLGEEDNSNIRRSSRRRSGKSALELLGVTPKKPRAVNSAKTTPQKVRQPKASLKEKEIKNKAETLGETPKKSRAIKTPNVAPKGKVTQSDPGNALSKITPKLSPEAAKEKTVSPEGPNNKLPEKPTRQLSIKSSNKKLELNEAETETKNVGGKESIKESKNEGERGPDTGLRFKRRTSQKEDHSVTEKVQQARVSEDNPSIKVRNIPEARSTIITNHQEAGSVDNSTICSDKQTEGGNSKEVDPSEHCSESSSILPLVTVIVEPAYEQNNVQSTAKNKRPPSPEKDAPPLKKMKGEKLPDDVGNIAVEQNNEKPMVVVKIPETDETQIEVEEEVIDGTVTEINVCGEASEVESVPEQPKTIAPTERNDKVSSEPLKETNEVAEVQLESQDDSREAKIETNNTERFENQDDGHTTEENEKDEEKKEVLSSDQKKTLQQIKKKVNPKKIVKAIIITPSGERKEVKLGPHVSTVKALEHILAGTTSGTVEDVAQLAVDVNKQIEATMLEADTGEDAQSGDLPTNDQQQSRETEDAGTDVGKRLATVDSDHKMAFEALSQLASGNSKDLPLAIELNEDDTVDADWLQEHGFQVVPLENDDQVWRRQMVGVQDKPLTGCSGGLRARPEKHVVASDDLQKMIYNLKPDDDISNHVYKVPLGSSHQMKCKHCDQPIMDRHDFRRHMTTHKDVEFKPWKCPICHYRAAVRAQIARHVNIHGELKPYVCRECGKGFNFKQKLVQHLKYHLDIRDKPCPLCDLAFHEHKTLKNHLRKIHNVQKMSPGEMVTSVTEPELEVEVDEAGETATLNTEKDTENPNIVKMEGGTTPDKEAVDENGGGETPPAMTPAQNQQKAMKKRARRASLLYGTRKTFLYTQQYKMGLLPAADRNNVPSCIKLPETMTEVISDSQEGETKKTPKLTPGKVTSGAMLDSVLQQYCRIDEGDGVPASFNCKLCSIEPFSSRTGFIHHLEQKHPKIRAWKCSTCDYSCRMRSSLIVHMKLHTGVKDYHCEVCGKSFAFKQKLKNHLKHHMNLREFACDLCSKAFNEKNDLTKHVRKVHVAERHCVCDVCNKAFKDVIQLRRHADSHSNDTKRYLCEHCNKYYRSKVSLAQHMKSHTCMFHCEICDKNFGSYSGFMAHKVMHDESFEGYECEICKKILHTKGSLTRHLAVAHSNDRPFSCNECTKCFKTKKDLKNHRIVHTTERKYSCEFCDFSSKRLESLRVHQRRHAEVKPFQCGLCGKEYTQKHALETHLRHHTGHMEASCPICGREFFTRYQLDTHLKRKHPVNIVQEPEGLGQGLDVEQPVTVFMCEECNAVFMTQDSLAVHILAEHMKQGWGAGGHPATSAAVGTVSEAGLLQAAGGTGQGLDEASIANTVEVITEADGGMSISSADHSMATTDFSEQTIEFVSISEPGSSKQRLVSLIRPVEGPGNQPAQEVDVRTIVTTDHDPETVEETEEKVTTLLDHQGNEQDTFVAIADPSSNQEMLVALPHHNFESLLAATEAEVQNVGTYIDSSGENYITVSTSDGDITEGNFVITGESAEGEEGIVTMTTGQTETEEEDQKYVAVAETIEIPIETESVTVLESDS